MGEDTFDGIPLKGTPRGETAPGRGSIFFREGVLGYYDSNEGLRINRWNPGYSENITDIVWLRVPTEIQAPNFKDLRPATGSTQFDGKTQKWYAFDGTRYVETTAPEGHDAAMAQHDAETALKAAAVSFVATLAKPAPGETANPPGKDFPPPPQPGSGQ